MPFLKKKHLARSGGAKFWVNCCVYYSIDPLKHLFSACVRALVCVCFINILVGARDDHGRLSARAKYGLFKIQSSISEL